MSFDYKTLDKKTRKRLKYFYLLTAIAPKSVVEREIDIVKYLIDEIYKRKNLGFNLPEISNDFKDKLEDLIILYENILKPKNNRWTVLLKEIQNEILNSNEFNKIVTCNNKTDNTYDFPGFRLYKLKQYFDLSKFKFPKDIPQYAFILTGKQLENYTTEEYVMLDLAINTLFRAEYFAMNFVKNFEFNLYFGFDDYGIYILDLIRFYSIQAIIAFFNFLEIFINGISWNYLLENETKMDDYTKKVFKVNERDCPTKELPDKIVLIPKLIKNKSLTRSDCLKIIPKKSTYKESYKANHKNFFLIKRIRDSITHYHGDSSHDKISIISNSKKWIEFARLAFNECIFVANKLWQDAGNDNDPCYINLNKKWWLERGLQRLNFELLQNRFGEGEVFTDEFKDNLRKHTLENEDYGIKLSFEKR